MAFYAGFHCIIIHILFGKIMRNFDFITISSVFPPVLLPYMEINYLCTKQKIDFRSCFRIRDIKMAGIFACRL